MGVRQLEAVLEEELSFDEVKKAMLVLKERYRMQATIAFIWKAKFRKEKFTLMKMLLKKDEYLKMMESQLSMLEGTLKRTKCEFENLLKYKDNIIERQRLIIFNLSIGLFNRKGHKELMKIFPEIKLENTSLESNCKDEITTHSIHENVPYTKINKKMFVKPSSPDLESVNDNDSAVIMEDTSESFINSPTYNKNIKVSRSVSDTLKNTRNISDTFKTRSVSVPSRSELGDKIATRNDLPLKRPLLNSLSSTASISSEDSDISPFSTMVKNSTYELNDSNKRKNAINYSPKTNVEFSKAILEVLNQRYYKSLDQNNAGAPIVAKLSDTSFECKNYNCENNISCMLSGTQCSSVTILKNCDPKMNYHNDFDATQSDYDSENEDKLFDKGKKYFISNETNVKNTKDDDSHVAYNRVMSNHRSVTKPKDVKYKRINKAKSKSLEELLGRLKLGDDKQFICYHGQSEA